MRKMYQSRTKGVVFTLAILLCLICISLCVWQFGIKQIVKEDQTMSPLEGGSNLQSEVYTIENGYISRILPQTTLRDLKSNLDEENVIVYKTDNTTLQDLELVGTGMKLVHNREEYKLAVLGDLSTDGKLGIEDLIKMKLISVGIKEKLVNEYEKAGDLNNDGEVGLQDLIKMNLAVINIVDMIAPVSFTPEIVTTKDTITVLGETVDVDSGIREYWFEINNEGWVQNTDKLNNKYTFEDLEMETKYSIRMKVVDNAGNTKITKRVEVETLNEENANITIVASTEEYTNKNILVAVNFSSNVARDKKEISIDGGENWTAYTEPITVEKNMTISARVVDSKGEQVEEKSKTITNIDKLAPNEFTVGVTTTANSITVNVGTEENPGATDHIKTAENACSGIKGYEYTIIDGIWQSVYTTTDEAETTHTFSDLKLGTEYTIKVKAIDNAGNERTAKNSSGDEENGEKVIVGTVEDINEIIEEKGGIRIVASTEEWTKEDIVVEVIYPEIEGLIKEISIDDGETWKEYSGSETIQTNTVIKARMKSSAGQESAEETLEITKIDKLAPLDFETTVEVEGNSITVIVGTKENSGATDHAETAEYACSGIKEYEYTIINGRWKETYKTEDETYTFSELESGKEYVIKVKAIDKAGNETGATYGDGDEENGETIIIGTIDEIIEAKGGITITPSTEDWTNEDITVEVVYPVIKGLTGEISIDDGDNWKEYTGSETIQTNTVVKARMKDDNGNLSTPVEEPITKIDKLVPLEFDANVETIANTIKITASTEDDDETAEYGKSRIAGYQFKINDEPWTGIIANGEHTFTDLEEGQTYKIIVKAVDNAGNETVANNCENGGMDVIPTQIPDYYGKEVTNYESSVEGVNWVVYHKDEEGRIYLITDDYIPYEQIPETRGGHNLTKFNTDTSFPNAAHFDNNVLNDYTGSAWISENTNPEAQKWLSKYLDEYPDSTNENMKAVAFMMDTDKWSEKFANNDMAEYAIGGPTIELFCESYKATHPNRYIECDSVTENGYQVKWNDSSSYVNEIKTDYIKTDCNNIYTKVYEDNWAVSIWLASPSAATPDKTINIRSGGVIENYHYSTSHTGFRPIVCLKSGFDLVKDEDGNYRIEDKRPDVTITFNANGGTVTPETISKKAGQEVTLPEPIRDEYEFKGWYIDEGLSTEVTLQDGQYTVTENVTLYAKWKIKYYGEKVTNYSAGGVNDWRVFYKDDENIYLIADDYIPHSNLPTTTGNNPLLGSYRAGEAYWTTYALDDYTGSEWIKTNTNPNAQEWLKKYLELNPTSINNNIKAVAYMMDTDKWSEKFADNDMAEYAIGGPTIELFCASYKATHPSKYIECDSINENGYNIKWSDGSYEDSRVNLTIDDFESIYIKNSQKNACGMWLASPWYSADSNYTVDYLMYAACNGNLNAAKYTYDSGGFRPIVCIKSGFDLEKNEDGTYRLEDKRTDCTLTFNANGGTVTPETITEKQGEEITLPTPTKSYTVTYITNGGSACDVGTATYEFDGWYTDAAGGEERTYITMPAVSENL